MTAINTPADGSHGYVALYNNQRAAVWAYSKFAALELARRHFKPPKTKLHMVHVELAEAHEKQVTHAPMM